MLEVQLPDGMYVPAYLAAQVDAELPPAGQDAVARPEPIRRAANIRIGFTP